MRAGMICGGALRVMVFVLLAVFVGSVEAVAPITSARQVLELPPDLAGRNLPVHLSGVVTATDPSWDGAFFIQDATAGIFVDSKGGAAPEAGDLVEVRGTAEPGAFAPIVGRPVWKRLGVAPLPAPRKVVMDQLMTGAEDGQRVEVSGWIHRIRSEVGDLFADVVAGGSRILLRLPEGITSDPSMLVGARISALGVPTAMSPGFNVRRMVSVKLWPASAEDFRILEPAGPDPLPYPPTPVSELSHYQIDTSPGRRFHVRGVVTYAGKAGLYLSDGTAGVLVRPVKPQSLKPGEIVSAAGFPVLERGIPVLEDAVIVPSGSSGKVKAVELTSLQQLRDGLLASSLVSARGRLVNSLVRDGETPGGPLQLTLALQSPEGIITAELQLTPEELERALHPMGTLLEVTGVCAVSADQDGRVRSFQILVPGISDLRVIEPASPFTAGRLLIALVVLLLVLLAIAVWSLLLLRKNLRLSGDVRERNAVLAERERLAGDLHDTLEQSLTGLGFQLQTTAKLVAQDPERAKNHLQIATAGIQQIHSELRHSIWNLKPAILDQFDLAEAISRNIRQAAEASGLEFEEIISDAPRAMDPFVQQNIFRIAQEAATNAIKHSRCTKIVLRMRRVADDYVIEIADDGCGMNRAATSASEGGHFGISGMRERASRLGARIDFIANSPHGTLVRLAVPAVTRSPATLPMCLTL